MAYFEFPHTRTYDSDLGWIIRNMKQLIDEYGQLAAYEVMHKKEYKELYDQVQSLADDLIDIIVPWDSSVEYRIYSIVEYQGTNYIALQDVPVGVMITNTDYWAPANTIVEQINAIAAETQEQNRRIELLNGVSVYMPAYGAGYEDNSGLFNFAKLGNDEFILFDLGMDACYPEIRDILVNEGCSKIAAIVISHWHPDHRSDPALWAASPFDMSETVFYIPLDTETYDQTLIQEMAWRNAFPQNTFIQPDENSVYTHDNAQLKFNNCGTAAKAYFEANTPNDYNQFSMICTLTCGNTSFMSSGDIGQSGLNYVYSLGFLEHVNIMTSPHHGANDTMLSFDAARIITPDYMWITDNEPGLSSHPMICPFIAYCAAAGTVIGSKGRSDAGAIFVSRLTENGGFTIPGFSKILYNPYNTISRISDMYVDGSYTGEISNGSQATPYKTLQEALSRIPDFPIHLHVSNITIATGVNLYINNKRGLQISFDSTDVIKYFYVASCQNVIINSLECTSIKVSGSNDITFSNLVINDASTAPTISDSSAIRINGMQINDAVNTPANVFNISRSTVTLGGTIRCNTNYTGHMFTVSDSFIASVAGKNAITGTPAAGSSVYQLIRSTVTGLDIASTANITGLFELGSTTARIMWDTTKAKPIIIHGTVISDIALA